MVEYLSRLFLWYISFYAAMIALSLAFGAWSSSRDDTSHSFSFDDVVILISIPSLTYLFHRALSVFFL